MLRNSLLVVFNMLLIACVFYFNSTYAFSDCESHWASKEINQLASLNIVKGYDDSTFKPDGNMTRAELITVINRILNNSAKSTINFLDVSSDKWYYQEVQKAVASGFITGDADGNLRPEDKVTREEAIVMLKRALFPQSMEYEYLNYSDANDVSSWAKTAISFFNLNRYVSGYPDNTFCPKKSISRAEVAKIICNSISTFATIGDYTGTIKGNVVVRGSYVGLKDLTVNGILIIAEGASNLDVSNVTVTQNLVIRSNDDSFASKIKVQGDKFDMRTDNAKQLITYENKQYGISFLVPEDYKVVNISDYMEYVDYTVPYLITFATNSSDELYFTTFDNRLKIYGIDPNFENVSIRKIGNYDAAIKHNEKDNTTFLFIKRDNLEYLYTFYNFDDTSIFDILFKSIELGNGSLVTTHQNKTYKNDALKLKFTYSDYVTVDDSYNSNKINEEKSFYKLILQVTNIIDLSSYSIDQLKIIFQGLEDTSAVIKDSKITKVYTYDAVEYTVENGDKVTKSLYVVLNNKLYHFVFTADEGRMNEVGNEIYNDIISSVEFQ